MAARGMRPPGTITCFNGAAPKQARNARSSKVGHQPLTLGFNGAAPKQARNARQGKMGAGNVSKASMEPRLSRRGMVSDLEREITREARASMEPRLSRRGMTTKSNQ